MVVLKLIAAFLVGKLLGLAFVGIVALEYWADTIIRDLLDI